MRRGCGSVGLLVVVTCALIASSHAFTIDLRALVLSIPGFTNTDFLETVSGARPGSAACACTRNPPTLLKLRGKL